MRIAVNTRFLLSHKMEGFGWYTYEVVKRLVENHPEHEFIFFFDRKYDEKFVFGGNKDFMINAIEYMMDDKGVIEARTKEVKLRLLDTARTRTEATKWRLLNIVLPLLFLAVFGIGFHYWRQRKYAR